MIEGEGRQVEIRDTFNQLRGIFATNTPEISPIDLDNDKATIAYLRGESTIFATDVVLFNSFGRKEKTDAPVPNYHISITPKGHDSTTIIVTEQDAYYLGRDMPSVSEEALGDVRDLLERTDFDTKE